MNPPVPTPDVTADRTTPRGRPALRDATPATTATAALVAVIAALASGCARPESPTLGQVEGRVTLDGRPLPAALVLFTPAGRGRTSRGVTGADGRYRLRYLRDIAGADVDEHAVRISTATEENGGREQLPPRYHARTELAATVRAGRNAIDFELSSR